MESGEHVSVSPQEIALGLQRRDLALFQRLIVQFEQRIPRYLIYLLGTREGIEDLVQETWLRVFERGASYNGRSRFEPWLFQIARNLAIDQARRRRTVSLDAPEESEEQVRDNSLASQDPSPFVLAARSQDAERLAESLNLLEPACREALLLRFQEDLSLQEIATIVGAPVSTVASRIYRSLAHLRLHLEKTNHGV